MSEDQRSLGDNERWVYGSAMGLGAVVVAVGAFQPMVEGGGPWGLVSNLGLLVLIASVSIAILTLRLFMDSGTQKYTSAAVSIVSLYVVFVAIRLLWDVLDAGTASDIGSGLYIALIGGAVSFVGSLVALIRMMVQR